MLKSLGVEMGYQSTEDKTIEEFTWTIENFAKLNSKTYSETFFVSGYPWRIVIYPKGNKQNNSDHLSIFLYAGDIANLPKGWSRYASFELALANQVDASSTIVKALGRVLHLLKTKKVKDMNDDACKDLQILWDELQTVGFDLSWLEPHLKSALGMKSYVERAAQVKRLRENVVALEKDLKIATRKLAEAEEGFVGMDLDAEPGYGAP